MTESPAATIARAVQIVSKTAQEWHLLMEALKDELSRMPKYRITEGSRSWPKAPEQWVRRTAAYDFSVQEPTGRRGRAPQIGTFNVILDLYEPDAPSGELGQSLIHVGWSLANDPWGYGYLTMPNLREDIHLVHERLFVWDEEIPEYPIEDWKEHSWLYLLPLDTIRNRQDIKSHIIDPVFALVEGVGVHEVFKNHPKVLRFAESEGRIHLLA